MDSIKGAIELRRRFDRLPSTPAPGAAVPADDDALPVFHWVAAGLAVPDTTPPVDPGSEPPSP